jgi:hypothetical protein
MLASEIIRCVEGEGGELWVEGDSLGYRLPESALPLLTELRTQKREVAALLRQRLPMPAGIRVVRWEPVPSPVELYRWLVVVDTDKFIRSTLAQISARLTGQSWKAGNWSLRELIGRLETIGVAIAFSRETDRIQ